MDLIEILKKTREELAENRINEALLILQQNLEFFSSNFRNDIISVSSNYKELSHEKRTGKISDQKAKEENAKITSNILEILEELEAEKSTSILLDALTVDSIIEKVSERISGEIDSSFENRFNNPNSSTLKRYRLIVSINIICLILLIIVGIVSGVILSKKDRGIEYINDFPDNLHDITKLVNSAKSEIIIATDVTSYGVMSGYELFHEYKVAVVNKIANNSNLNFELFTLSDSLERELVKWEFGSSELEYSELRGKAKYEDFFDEFTEIKSIQGVENQLVQCSRDFESSIGGVKNQERIQIKKLRNDIPLLIWLIDGERAIYSFYDQVERKTEASFFTDDPKMIEVLKNYIKSYRKETISK